MSAGIAGMWLEGLFLACYLCKIWWCIKLKNRFLFWFLSCPLVTYGSGVLNEADPAGLVSCKLDFKSYLDRLSLATPLQYNSVYKGISQKTEEWA